MSWFNKILSKTPDTPDEPSHSTGYFDMDGAPTPLSADKQDMKAAREVVRAAALRTATTFGIPPQWLAYEVVTISDDDKAYFQLQISLRIWDEQLWAQSSAFEGQVLKRIRESDVNVARAVRAVLWRILPDAGCPHDKLSDHEAWRAETAKARAAAYDKLRATLLLAQTPEALATPQPVLQPKPTPIQEQASGFCETIPTSHSSFGPSEFPVSAFPTTRPAGLGDELAPTQPAKF